MMDLDISTRGRGIDGVDMLVVGLAVVTVGYYYGGRWLLNQGIIGETAMLFVAGLTVLMALPIALYALLMIEDGLTGNGGDSTPESDGGDS